MIRIFVLFDTHRQLIIERRMLRTWVRRSKWHLQFVNVFDCSFTFSCKTKWSTAIRFSYSFFVYALFAKKTMVKKKCWRARAVQQGTRRSYMHTHNQRTDSRNYPKHSMEYYTRNEKERVKWRIGWIAPAKVNHILFLSRKKIKMLFNWLIKVCTEKDLPNTVWCAPAFNSLFCVFCVCFCFVFFFNVVCTKFISAAARKV